LQYLDPQKTFIFNFITPGNKAIVTTPILTFLQSDDELAHALGHDRAHVLLEHRREVESENRLWIPLFGVLLIGGPWTLVGGIVVLAALDRFIYWDMPRVHELEAGRLATKLAVKAGYEAKGAVDFWRRLKGEKETGRLSSCTLVS
jgi:predicted Zn-dependent protease